MIDPLSCCAPCPVKETVNIPGTPGTDGAPGAAGANGLNAYTVTTANFTVPAIGSNVTVSVGNSGWMVPGQNIFVQGPADFTVSSVPNATSVILTFLGYTGNVAPGAVIAAGAGVSPGGIEGPVLNPLPIADGGTGATTAAAALSNLGIAQNITAAYASGAAYTLTNVSQLMAFGTTSPTITIPTTGVYLILARARIDFVGTTFAANQTCTLKVRRTAAVAGDIANATITYEFDIVTTRTQTTFDAYLPIVQFSATAADVIQLWGVISAAPGAGSVEAVEATLIAIPWHLP